MSLSGRVTQARSGAALPGLRVVALANVERGHALTLGSSTSRAGGRFRIQFGDKAEVRERLLALRRLPGIGLTLRVEDAGGHVLLAKGQIMLDRADVSVSLEVPISREPVPGNLWAELGRELQQDRVGTLSGVVRLLRAEGPLDGSAGIPMLTRQAMLYQLEQAFLDPTGILRKVAGDLPSFQDLHDPEEAGAFADRLRSHRGDAALRSAYSELMGKAASFAGLDEVDWAIDPSLFDRGDIGAALDKYKKEYVLGDGARLPRAESTLSNYRDYLLAIWTKFASKIVYVAPNLLTEKQAIQQLEARFHQKFTTYDFGERNANSILIPLVSKILVAPKGKGFGFGIPAGSIAAQGTLGPRAYLDYLIGLSHVSAEELGLRYRLDLTRADTALSSPVMENISTLQGFFRDSFQCDLDPAHVDPDVHNQPIIPDVWLGNAPFFLYYDEWLRQQAPFYPENHLDIRRVLPVDIVQPARDQLANMVAGKVASQKPNIPTWKFCQDVIAVWDALQAGHAHFYAGEFGLALVDYRSAKSLAFRAMQDNVLQKLAMGPFYTQRKNRPLGGMKDLAQFMDPRPDLAVGGLGYGDSPAWARDRLALRLAYYSLFTIPICLGDAELAMGDYEQAIYHYGQATRFEVGIARESDGPGYRPWYLDSFQMYWRGDKPYTARLNGSTAPDDARYPAEEDDREYDDFYDTTTLDLIEDYAKKWSRRIPHLAETRYCRLRQANAMLEWADTLYRTDEPTGEARARELYKAALWLHGKIPPICPTWPARLLEGGGVSLPGGFASTFLHQTENPALVSQTARAYRGIFQIDHGLNYYGERDDIVPILRYRPLKDTADRTSAMARAAQLDFLLYTERVEAAITGRLQLANFLQKAKLQSSIADEQQAIAQHDVAVAQDQVAAVKAAIKAKEDEIAQHDSLFGQIGDAIKGVKSIFEGVPDDTKSAVGAGIKSEATGEAMVGEGMLGLGAGASVMTGFGIFAVVGYVTLSGMADADNQRSADLKTLMDKGLPAAEAAVVARQHGVTIARYQKQIAQADVDLAQTLLAFEQNRLLNQNFWIQLAQVARRLLRRYLELGARQTWLAERALAFEQDRTIRIVRMDYFPAPLQGVTGADMMQADLAELEATRVEGMKSRVPVRRTISLAREFPLAYGQLKATGRCGFRTEEEPFRRAHPGTSGYRLRAVSVAVQQVDFSQPLRGSLLNRGVSISRPGRPGEHVLVRPSESMPLSEFRLQDDLAVYGLPNETLLTFEGSSIETFWELGFPKAANSSGLGGLLDVLLTFDLFCEFAPESYEADLAALPTSERKWILVSAARYQPTSVAALAGAAANVDVVFDLRGLRLLPRQEKSRKIKNVAAFLVTPDILDFTAKLVATSPTISVPAAFQESFVTSNILPNASAPLLPPSPLNAFEGLDPDQIFTLAISKPANPGVDFQHVSDVVLAIEYEAGLV
ncbi:hypothetical protein P12x_001999 [Tundrisphaera lichenicola]|uniref:Tc toxin subunit A-related protein n=1 Tax=Tundrisphaera lichenicola TaxID=2029860 RepID=UPI003EBE57FE